MLNGIIFLMSSKYTCENCQTGFTTKKLLTAHNKECKKPEVKKPNNKSYLKPAENEVVFEYDNNDNQLNKKSKETILKLIDKAHNILYHAENIEGEEALNDIMNFLFIKLLSTILSDKDEEGKIDLLNKRYYETLYDDDILDDILEYFKDLKNLSLLPINELRSMDENNDAIRQMGEILKTHPITGMIYTENNFINAKKSTTIQKLLNEVINKINIDEFENNEDMIGDIYEHIINAYVKKGSKLGQFFTPRNLMKLVLHYKYDDIKANIKQLNKKDKIKVYDSCMGTAGWLVSGFNMLKDKYEKRLLLSGGDVKPSTFQYGLMNLILTLQKFPHDVMCDSSLTHINKDKHHLILTNPPFQTSKNFSLVKDNFNQDKYTTKNKIKLEDVYKLQNNNPPIQFMELNLYKLEDNGMCIIVLPYGELFNGARHKKAREYFMKHIDITDIISIPGGVFSHTGIKTAVIVFNKDNTGTKGINFLEANDKCNKLTRVISVTKDDIDNHPHMSWYCNDYLERQVKQIDTSFEWIEFGKMFTLEKGKIQSSKVVEDSEGEGVLINWSMYNKYKKIKDYTLDGENLFISTKMPNGDDGGYIVITYYNGKCDFCDLMSKINPNDNYKSNINIKYIYYYLRSIKDFIENTYEKGSCNKSLDIDNFNKMELPVPSLEWQNELVSQLDLIYEKNVKASNDKIESLKINNELFINFKVKNIETKPLGDLCEIENGKRIVKGQVDDGEYPVLGGGGITSFYTNEYTREGKTCKISREGMSLHNCVMILNYKYYLNSQACTIKSKSNNLINEYLWYYLDNNKELVFNCGRGTAQKAIDMDEFNKIQIPVPSIEVQNEIVKYCDRNNQLIKLIEEEMEDTKLLGKELLKF